MFTLTSRHSVFLLMFLCLTEFSYGLHSDTFLYEKAQFYVRELGKTLQEIEASHNIQKRSAPSIENKDKLVKSLLDICSTVNLQVLTTTATTLEQHTVGDDSLGGSIDSGKVVEGSKWNESTWPLPEPFLVTVKAERDGDDKVKVEFDLVHSSKTFVARLYSFDYQMKFVDIPEGETGGEARESRVSLNIDISSFCEKDPYSSNDNVAFLIGSVGRSHYYTLVYVDICRFDSFWNQSKNNGDWQKKAGNDIAYSQILPPLRLRVLSDVGDIVFIERGKNPVIDLEVNFTYGFSLIVYVKLWDWESDDFVLDTIRVGMFESDTKGIHVYPDFGPKPYAILKLDVLNETVSYSSVNRGDTGNDSFEEMRPKSVDAKLRITVNLGLGERSGQLNLIYSWRDHDWENPTVVNSFNVERKFKLKLPYKISEYPANTVDVSARKVMCDKDGSKGRPSHGKNCNIDCLAHGTDIQSIFIIKSHPYRPPVRSRSFILNDVAYAIQDVGPASGDNEGDYRCTVVTKNGKTKSVNITLYTSGFTKVTNLTLEDFGNSTSRLVCTAYGAPPLNISISTRSGYGVNSTEERIDDKVGAVATRESFENKTTMLTLFICTDDLRYPIYDVICEASGALGQQSRYIHLPSYIERHILYTPKMIDESSTVQMGEDGTTATITCVATANGEPMDMMVAYGGKGKAWRIDHKPGNERAVTEMDGAALLTLIVPTRSIVRPTSWLYCGAENEYGDDWKEFYLPDYGIDI